MLLELYSKAAYYIVNIVIIKDLTRLFQKSYTMYTMFSANICLRNNKCALINT